jgi:hypothetical protein
VIREGGSVPTNQNDDSLKNGEHALLRIRHAAGEGNAGSFARNNRPKNLFFLLPR